MRFAELNLSDSVLSGIKDAGFTNLTPVQEASLPLALAGKDVAVQAQTGTGKTAAFLITIFNRIRPAPQPGSEAGRPAPEAGRPARAPRALIIAPTRELAVQILSDASVLGSYSGLDCLAVYGGVDYQKQKERLEQGTDVLVGTPGRLIDYFKQNVLNLKAIEIIVVDEADRMFDMGFIADIRYMLRRMPPYNRRQSMLFSATLSWRVMELAYEHMNNPEKIEISPEQVTVEKVEQGLFHVGRAEKFSLLLGLMRRERPERSMIFVNTKREAERVVERLDRNGFPAQMISGDIPQKKRLKVIEMFKSGHLPALVATDVASRGLHVEGVTHVFNYDLPQDPEDYVHRIGRTARAGAAGKAYSFADEEFVFGLEPIQEYIGMKIPVVWPDEELFVKEKRRTPEERRQAEERDRLRREEKAALEARRGRGRGGRGRPGAGKGERPRPKPEAARASGAGNPIIAKPGDPSGEAKKKRRRRRKKPAGEKPNATA